MEQIHDYDRLNASGKGGGGGDGGGGVGGGGGGRYNSLTSDGGISQSPMSPYVMSPFPEFEEEEEEEEEEELSDGSCEGGT